MKASNAESHELTIGHQGINRMFNLGLKEAKINAIISPLMYLLMMIVIVVIITFGGLRVASGIMSPGNLVAFLLYLFQIVMPITWFAMFINQLNKAAGASERIVKILGLTPEERKEGLKLDLTNEKIRVNDVHFTYDGTEEILKGVTIEAYPGQVVALVGPSGGGKSTIFSLLERYYEPVQGSILLGEIPITNISLEFWRSQIGYVSQNSPMMIGTIRDNICYGIEELNISDDKIWEVARMAYADEFISQFTNGLDTEVGERGVKLSGGQRQRIAIARAFLRNPKILMMDEATANLDSQSEGVVQNALFKLMENRTTFVIAHRLSTILESDRIYFIENGTVTGSGTHLELLENHPLYREYANIQLAENS